MNVPHHALNCPYFVGNYMKSCTALRDTYVPSRSERESFCTVPMYTLCSNYQQRRFSEEMEQAPQHLRS
jgi:hypothetical protein